MNDEDYMKLALELAQKGVGSVNPNPMVGAVIVKNDKVIGQGYHERYGELHAERNALKSCTDSPEGATMYVTLEPCCHQGKTPPCTEAIIESGISKVVIGSSDPNPLVSGKGIQILKNHGIKIVKGVMKEECDALNFVFFHYIKTKTPYVVMKYAMTIDGKIATRTGKSQWVSSNQSRMYVQECRNRYSAIMVGVGTIIADDPRLTCRLEKGRNPIRVICDTNLRTPLQSLVVQSASQIRTIIATANTDKRRKQLYLDQGCEIIDVPLKGESIDLRILAEKLGECKIDSVYLEGGSAINWSALESGIVNRLQVFIAPKIFGGLTAKSPVAGLGIDLPMQAIALKQLKVSLVGEDVLLEGEV